MAFVEAGAAPRSIFEDSFLSLCFISLLSTGAVAAPYTDLSSVAS